MPPSLIRENDSKVAGNVPPEFMDMMKDPSQSSAPPLPSNLTPPSNIQQFQPTRPTKKREERSVDTSKLAETKEKIRKVLDKYDEVKLPSLGRFYDGINGPKDGILHIRSMTSKEELILTQQKYAKKGTTIDMILGSCIIEKQYDPAKLLKEDITYLLICLRVLSQSVIYDAEVKCPECSQKFEAAIDLNNDLSCRYCPDNFGPEDLKGVLPKTELEFTYRLCRGVDETAMHNHREERINFQGANAVEDMLVYKVALLLEEIDGIGGGPVFTQDIVTMLPTSDMAFLRNLINNPPFGVDTKVDLLCPRCEVASDISLPLDANFFFPKTKKEPIETNY